MAASDQHKIGSGFGFRSTAVDVVDGIDLTGKLEDCDVAGIRTSDDMTAKGVYPYAVDPDEAARLWSLSAELTGVYALT